MTRNIELLAPGGDAVYYYGHDNFNKIEDEQFITSDNLCEWHRRWLGNVYEWAGQYRSVNMGKADF